MHRHAVSRRFLGPTGLLAAASLLASGAASAASLSAYAGVVAGAGTADIPAGCTTYGPPSDVSFFQGYGAGFQVLGGNAACGYSGGWSTNTSTGTTATLTNNASLAPTALGNPGFSGNFDGTASSHANYGSLGASAHGHQDVPGYSPTALEASSAAATFSDTLSAAVPKSYTDISPDGFVSYVFELHGSESTPGTPVAFFPGEAVTGFMIQNDAGPVYIDFSSEVHVGSTATAAGLAGVTPGWTTGVGALSGGVTYESERFAIDLTKSWDFKAGLIVNAYGNADDLFSSTAKLVGIDLFDSAGNPISGFSITAASGTDYLGTAAAVPEPGGLALMLAGLLGLGGWRRVRASRG